LIRVETMKSHPLANLARVETMKNTMPKKSSISCGFPKMVDMFPRTDGLKRTGEKWMSSDEIG